MLLTFSITVFEVLERYGILWTSDEQDAYLHAWDVVGAYLGIGSPSVVDELEKKYKELRYHAGGESTCPRAPSSATSGTGCGPRRWMEHALLLDQIRDRQWIDPAPEGPFEITSWSSVRAGRILVHALLDELQAAMPRSLEQLPIAIIRALLPAVVCKRLNLGGSGLWFRGLAPASQAEPRDRAFTLWNGPNRIGAKTLRLLANDVTTDHGAVLAERRLRPAWSRRLVGRWSYADGGPENEPWVDETAPSCSPTSKTARGSGSTTLPSMEIAIPDHQQLVGAAVTTPGRRVVKSTGDGLLAVFADAAAAVDAAVEIQRRVMLQTWPRIDQLRVRIGLNTAGVGERPVTFSAALRIYAARLQSAGHGGQILLSGTTAEACSGRLRPDQQLIDLGRYLIRGFDEPLAVYSVVADGCALASPHYEQPPADTTNFRRTQSVARAVATTRSARRCGGWPSTAS